MFINVSDVVINRLINTDNSALFKLLRDLRDSALQQEQNILAAKEREEKTDRKRARTHEDRKYEWGVVYILKADGHPHYKIGKTRQFSQRMSTFGVQRIVRIAVKAQPSGDLAGNSVIQFSIDKVVIRSPSHWFE